MAQAWNKGVRLLKRQRRLVCTDDRDGDGVRDGDDDLTPEEAE